MKKGKSWLERFQRRGLLLRGFPKTHGCFDTTKNPVYAWVEIRQQIKEKGIVESPELLEYLSGVAEGIISLVDERKHGGMGYERVSDNIACALGIDGHVMDSAYITERNWAFFHAVWELVEGGATVSDAVRQVAESELNVLDELEEKTIHEIYLKCRDVWEEMVTRRPLRAQGFDVRKEGKGRGRVLVVKHKAEVPAEE